MGAQPVPVKGLTLYLKGAQAATSSSFFGSMQIRRGVLPSFPMQGKKSKGLAHIPISVM
jgi:hypothetical protein